MPSYNLLNKPADILGNGTDSSSMRGFAYGTTNQTIGETLTITTGFRPAYIAVCYGKDAKRALLIYNETMADYFDPYLYATTESELSGNNIEDLPYGTDREEWEFDIISISNTGFTLKATTIATENCTLWWFALAETPNKTSNTISGCLPHANGNIIINCGFVPDFLVILRGETGLTSLIINDAIYWNKQRSTTGYIGAGNSFYLMESVHSDAVNNPSGNTYIPWVNWTDSGFITNGFNDDVIYYFAAKGLSEASE